MTHELGEEKAREPGGSEHGSASKISFAKAPKTGAADMLWRIALRAVERFTLTGIVDFARRKLTPSCEAISDGLNYFPGMTATGCGHSVCVIGSDRGAAEDPISEWVSTALKNIKPSLSDTYRHFESGHAPC